MAIDPLLQTLRDITDFLQSQHLAHALIGGLATTVRGEPRSTLDVDLLVHCDVSRCLELVGGLDATRFQPLFGGVHEVVETAYLLPLVHRQTSVKVDLALGLTGFEQNAILNATQVDFGGFPVSVISAEDLMLMKTLAGRPRDTDDVAKIVLRQGDALDWDYVLQTARALEQAIGHELVSPLERLRGNK
jgi:predicted nucleotidyltransferase